MSAADTIAAFRDAMTDAGLETDAAIIADGRLHRIHIEGDKPGSKNGWYCLHDGDLPAGAFGSWKTASQKWCAKPDRILTSDEREANQKRYAKARRERDAQQQREYERARRKAAVIWKAAKPAPDDHPYLARKGIKAHGVKLYQGRLVIPARDASSILHTQHRRRRQQALSQERQKTRLLFRHR